jgi:hypothetical protein
MLGPPVLQAVRNKRAILNASASRLSNIGQVILANDRLKSLLRPSSRYTGVPMKLVFAMLVLVSSCAAAAPPREPAPAIEPTGPLRAARYVKPFAQAQPNGATRDYAARYTYGTPFYYFGYPYGSYGYSSYYGLGAYYYHPIYSPYGAYYPSY